MKGFKAFGILCLFCLITLAGVYHQNGQTAQAVLTSPETNKEALPTVGSLENLQKILDDSRDVWQEKRLIGDSGQVIRQKAAAPEISFNSLAGMDSAQSVVNGTDYSGTNIQVQGVDEADTVKTDGEYIYKITNNQLVVVKAYPAEEMQVVSTLSFDRDANPAEMYVSGQYLTVILNKHTYPFREVYSIQSDQGAPEQKILPGQPLESSVQILVYDVSDRTDPKQIREIEIDGSYVSSRLIEDNLYIVNNQNIPIRLLKEQPELLTTPAYRDSADGGEVRKVGYEEICYFPGSNEPNYLIIAGINLNTPGAQKTEVKTYLGAGQSIYCSLENLFVAVPEYKQAQAEPVPKPLPESLIEPADTADNLIEGKGILPNPRFIEENTVIYKFSLKEGDAEYAGKGSVPGRILNQFSMDEHRGYFRIATTQSHSDSTGQMANHLFILDGEMNTAGKIENIAPGEKIYSIRFMGDRGYMVTFKTVDPLFVLDLKDPHNPVILGELKIPGYSNYLHPYDENHIIGFGKETVEVEQPHWSGGTVKNAYYLGMKIALFDVSDVENPKEKFKIEIGDRGTESELFFNHKALLFSKEKNLMAFPVTVYDNDSADISKHDYLAQKDPRLVYGEPVFQGAFVYRLSLEKGFELQGMITHQPDGKISDLQYRGQYNYNRDISRILYIEDTLYTLSNRYLQAHSLEDLGLKGGVELIKGI